MYEGGIYLNKIVIPEPINRIVVHDDVIEVTKDEQLFLNCKKVETLEDDTKAISILVKGLCSTVSALR